MVSSVLLTLGYANLTPKILVITPNPNGVYTLLSLELKKDGPLVDNAAMVCRLYLMVSSNDLLLDRAWSRKI